VSLLAVGLSHHTTPTWLLERSSLAGDDLRKALHELVAGADVGEAVVLSTCNRTEVYAASTSFHGGLAEVGDVLARVTGLPLEQLREHLYPLHDARAVQHLLSVACGLDSALVGEAQIQGQVREAFRTADEEGTVGRELGDVFRQALRVGRRARTETGIDQAGRSVVSLGLDVAGRLLAGSAGEAAPGPETDAGLVGRAALVVGAGSTGALAATLLRAAGVGSLEVANRTAERAERVAMTLQATAVPEDGLVDALARADVVVSGTAAAGFVLTAEDVSAAVARRDGRPLVLLDLALPHDVDPGVAVLPGVHLVDLDDLRDEPGAEAPESEVAAVRAIVDAEVLGYAGRQQVARVAPTVAALRAKADGVLRDELARLAGRVPDLDPGVRAELELTVSRVVDKLVHAPTVRVKELAQAPGGDRYAEALRELFGLDRTAVTAVSAPVPPGTREAP